MDTLTDEHADRRESKLDKKYKMYKQSRRSVAVWRGYSKEVREHIFRSKRNHDGRNR
jgi:hypothetical protein